MSPASKTVQVYSKSPLHELTLLLISLHQQSQSMNKLLSGSKVFCILQYLYSSNTAFIFHTLGLNTVVGSGTFLMPPRMTVSSQLCTDAPKLKVTPTSNNVSSNLQFSRFGYFSLKLVSLCLKTWIATLPLTANKLSICVRSIQKSLSYRHVLTTSRQS